MGLDTNGCRFLLQCRKQGVDFSMTSMIGRQGLHLSKQDLADMPLHQTYLQDAGGDVLGRQHGLCGDHTLLPIKLVDRIDELAQAVHVEVLALDLIGQRTQLFSRQDL